MTNPFRGSRALVPLVSTLALGIGLLLVPAISSGTAQQPDERLREAVERLRDGDAEGAMQQFEEFLEDQPDSVQGRFWAGMATYQLERKEESFEHFARAGELQPGFGEAHYRACLLGYEIQNYEGAWSQCILARQAGMEVPDMAFQELRQVSDAPDDFERRMNAPRVFLGGIDTEAIKDLDTLPFTAWDPQVGGIGESPQGPGDLSTGNTVVAQLQGDFAQVLRQFGQGLQDSPNFAIVPRLEIARWVLQVKADEVTRDPPHRMTGFVKLFDYDSDTEIYSRPIELRDISSVNDLRNDVLRIVGYMERWLRENQDEVG